MNRKVALALLAAASLPVTAIALTQEVGTAFCFGTNCPCGNNDPTGGCANSSGQGARLIATGSTSVAADDITFEASRLPRDKVALLVFSRNQRNIPFGDGRMCVGPGMHRVRWHYNSGQTGTVTATGILGTLAVYGTDVNAGETWHVQMWYRDPVQGFACHDNATVDKTNLTNAYTVTFTP